MKERDIASRIMKTGEFEDAVFYRAGCSCGDKSCDMVLALEKGDWIDDRKLEGITLGVFKDVHWGDEWETEDPFLKRIWRRVTCALRMLVCGYVEMNGWFIFEDEEQIRDYIKALEEGITHLKEE